MVCTPACARSYTPAPLMPAQPSEPQQPPPGDWAEGQQAGGSGGQQQGQAGMSGGQQLETHALPVSTMPASVFLDEDALWQHCTHYRRLIEMLHPRCEAQSIPAAHDEGLCRMSALCIVRVWLPSAPMHAPILCRCPCTGPGLMPLAPAHCRTWNQSSGLCRRRAMRCEMEATPLRWASSKPHSLHG